MPLLQPEDDETHVFRGNDETVEFRSAALALLCLLDAALAWRPADPLGWMGQAEDAEGAVLAREKGMCSFSFFAGKLRKALKKASAGGMMKKTEPWRGCLNASSIFEGIKCLTITSSQ